MHRTHTRPPFRTRRRAYMPDHTCTRARARALTAVLVAVLTAGSLPAIAPPALAASKKTRTQQYFASFAGVKIGGSAGDMPAYTVTTNTGDVIKPAVKYRLASNNTLEIHLWLAYVTYRSAGAVPVTVSANSTLAKQYRAGVKSYWSLKVNDAHYQYKTTTIFHSGVASDVQTANTNPQAQQYVLVCIGGVCPAYAPANCPESVAGNHWYHAHPSGPVGWPGTPSIMYLPTTAQTKTNRTAQKRTNLTGIKFSAACAHETGHILGLSDAYPARDARRLVDRMDENPQTALKSHGIWGNLMKDQNSVKQALPNDLHMALVAYSTQVKNYEADFMQNYKTYTWYDTKTAKTNYRVSIAITNHKDLVRN